MNTLEAIETAQSLAAIRRLLRSGEAKFIRLEAGLTQGELARLLDVTPGAVSRWEAGDRIPRGEVALRYRELLRGLS